ncbi:hypothetical protein [Streptomyces sp. NPDC056242]|uniref:hypothetical protein n=1 Tax=Streptomyces sp. NPDC056242 TaxID=3345760 RepID=UPI0035DBFC94
MNSSGKDGRSSVVHEWINSLGVLCAVVLSVIALHRDQTQRASDEEREAMKVNVYLLNSGAATAGVMVENQQSIRIVDVTVRLEVGGVSVQQVQFGEVHSCTQDWFLFGDHQSQVRTDALVVLQFRDGSGHRWQVKPGPVLNKIGDNEPRRDDWDELVAAWASSARPAPPAAAASTRPHHSPHGAASGVIKPSTLNSTAGARRVTTLTNLSQPKEPLSERAAATACTTTRLTCPTSFNSSLRAKSPTVLRPCPTW